MVLLDNDKINRSFGKVSRVSIVSKNAASLSAVQILNSEDELLNIESYNDIEALLAEMCTFDSKRLQSVK